MTSRWSDFVHIERTPNGVGRITLDRPKALNALDLGMIRALAEALLAWRDDPAVVAVAIRGTSKDGPFGAFCAGGDAPLLPSGRAGERSAAGGLLYRGVPPSTT